MRSSTFALAAATASMALAQSSTTTPAPSTVSLYLPFGGDNLAASIITTAPTATVYAIGCEIQSGACAPGCSLDSSVTVTEGESTLQYTWSAGMQAALTGSSLIPDVTTVACSLYGGSSASSAVCTAYSVPNSGAMDNGTETTTLYQSQITYMPVTVTASMDGASPTISMSGTNTVSGSASSSSGGAAAAATTNAGVATRGTKFGAVVVAVGLGAMAVL